MSVAGITHDGRNIGKVEVDDAGDVDKIGNTLNAVTEHVVRIFKRIGKRDSVFGDLFESFVRDYDERIDEFTQTYDSVFSLNHALSALERERLRHNADGENAHVLCDLGNDRSGACSGPAAHTGCDEHHIGAADDIGDILDVFLCGLLADLRIGACTVSLGDFFTDGDFCRSARSEKNLLVTVHRDEVDALNIGFDHAVDCVSAAAADADYFYLNATVVIRIEFKSHFFIFLLAIDLDNSTQYYCNMFFIYLQDVF